MTVPITSGPAASECRLQIDCQPIVQLIFNKTTAYDARIFLIADDVGQVPYKEFKPLAERTDMIIQLEQWIFKSSCRMALEMARKGTKFDYLSVNMSARYLKMDCCIPDLLDVLNETGVPSGKICLEILESDLEAQDGVIDKLHELKREGFMIAVDDYSAVYMPLGRLDSVPADVIKLDKALTGRIIADKKAEETTAAIIQRAKGMKCEVIAKAIEDQRLQYLLMALGCEKSQGAVDESMVILPDFPVSETTSGER